MHHEINIETNKISCNHFHDQALTGSQYLTRPVQKIENDRVLKFSNSNKAGEPMSF